MKPWLASFLVSALILPVLTAAEHKELKAFPPAGEGMKRFVIVLPHKERGEEDAFKVEIIVGKTMMTDGVNRLHMGGAIEEVNLEGWGYTYYEVKKAGPVASTLIGVPPGQPKVERFVPMAPLLIRYNSRLPVVIYVPEGFEVRHRIWTAGEEVAVEEG
jgi:ecotin